MLTGRFVSFELSIWSATKAGLHEIIIRRWKSERIEEGSLTLSAGENDCLIVSDSLCMRGNAVSFSYTLSFSFSYCTLSLQFLLLHSSPLLSLHFIPFHLFITADNDLKAVEAWVTSNPSIVNAQDEHGYTPIHGRLLSLRFSVCVFFLVLYRFSCCFSFSSLRCSWCSSLITSLNHPYFLFSFFCFVSDCLLLLLLLFFIHSAAASYGHLELLKYLLSRGGNPNVADCDGDSPLHYIDEDSLASIEVLCQFGANLLHKNNEGQTPLDKADAEEDRAAGQALREAMSKRNLPFPPLPPPIEDDVDQTDDLHGTVYEPEFHDEL